MARVRIYHISISGTAARLLRKHYPEFYGENREALEAFYRVRARNGDEAKEVFLESMPVIAELYRRAAEILGMNIKQVLRAYPG